MGERVVYFNRQYVRETEAAISIHDRGFYLGDAAFDISRTVNRKPFKWKEHIERLYSSLRYLQIDVGLTREQMYDITFEVFNRNKENLGPNDDYLIIHRVTRGVGFLVPLSQLKPTILVYCYPINFASLAKKYIDGIHLVIASTRRVPSQCLDPKAKVQNAINRVLGELEANSIDPNAYAVMLDLNGFLSECTAQNIFLVKHGKLFTPKRDNILEGVTRATFLELAKSLNIESSEVNLCVYDLFNADEAFITANSFTLFPVAKVNNKPLFKPIPGPVSKRLLSAWDEMAGVDIVQQALSHLKES